MLTSCCNDVEQMFEICQTRVLLLMIDRLIRIHVDIVDWHEKNMRRTSMNSNIESTTNNILFLIRVRHMFDINCVIHGILKTCKTLIDKRISIRTYSRPSIMSIYTHRKTIVLMLSFERLLVLDSSWIDQWEVECRQYQSYSCEHSISSMSKTNTNIDDNDQ
jgi:hypothetical protein